AGRPPNVGMVGRRSLARPVLWAGAVVALAGIAVVGGLGMRWRRGGPALPPAASVVAGPGAGAPAEGQRLVAAEVGEVTFAGSGITYRPGTVIAFFPSTRTLKLERGEVDVDVTEHRPMR